MVNSKENLPSLVVHLSILVILCQPCNLSLLYLESYLSNGHFSYVTSYPITEMVVDFAGMPFPESLTLPFDVLSLCSFLCMWIATALLLSQYRYKMGRITYFSLLGIPLIYYIFPFENYFGNLFYPLSSPLFIGLLYILIFSATKQVGALVFGLVFWTASSLVYSDQIRKSLLLSSIGIAILYGSLAIAPLQYHAYPPYGLITMAFIPLGTYLIFVGIFISAKHISRDSELRKEFYKSAASQLTLLKAIGVSQMEKELEEETKSLEKHFGLSESEEHHMEEQLKEENVKQILHDVLNELYYSKGKKDVLIAYTILTGLNSSELQRVIEILSYIKQKL